MTPERWQQVKEILQSALERKPAERSAFVAQACANDTALRSEVESLISSHEQAGHSLEAMAAEAATEMLADDQAGRVIGKRIGRYEVLNLIGRGGMGEVFLAQDASLGRKVALKLLRGDFTKDQERLRRFGQEARSASALNHPNILTIHEIGQEDSLHFIATEYVEGETLREHVSRVRMTLGQVLDVAVQTASALAAAHQAGIIHRDIKPENVMLRADGYVKVLDFGLAKLVEPKTLDTTAPALAKSETAPGLVMGTVTYMSPEQARGFTVDARTDIWSLGVMLYEMVSGRQPFDGETRSDVVSLILQKEPLPLAHQEPEVPAELERIVRKALRKDKEERYQTAKDLLIDLKSLRKELEHEAEIERSSPPAGKAAISSGKSTTATAHATSSAEYIVTEIKQHKQGVFIALGAIVMLAVVWYVLQRFKSETKEASIPSSKLAFTQLTDQPGPEYFPSLSEDGKSFVYASKESGNWDIYFQRVGGKRAINLTTDSTADDTQPAFSPDGKFIAFRSEREGGGIFVMGATGESPKRLTNFGYNPAWSRDAKEIACAELSALFPTVRDGKGSLWVVNVATGEKRSITKDIQAAAQPQWSPSGQRIAYWSKSEGQKGRDIWTIAATGGQPVLVVGDGSMNWNPVWAASGNCLYFLSDRGGSMNLWHVPVNEQTGKVSGQAQQLTTPSPYAAHLSISADGRHLAYVGVINRVNLQRVDFVPEKEMVADEPIPITQDSKLATYPDLSSDGQWIVFDAQGEKQEDLYVIRRDGTDRRQLTDDIYRDRAPRWAPDGKQIAFFSDRSGNMQIWKINPDGSGLQQLTYMDGSNRPVWSPDCTQLIYNADGKSFLMEVGKPWNEQSPQALPTMSDSGGWFARSWSPDGRILAGTQASPGLGGMQVVQTSGIVIYSLVTQRYEKLTDFGQLPLWLSDSRRLLFFNEDKIYLVDSQSKRVHEVFSIAPRHFRGFTASRDDRLIYFSIETTEADIWLITLEEGKD